jgi:predicted ABC-type ATPase
LSNSIFHGKTAIEQLESRSNLCSQPWRRPVAIVTIGAPGSGQDHVVTQRENCCCDYLQKRGDIGAPSKDQYAMLDRDFWANRLCPSQNEHSDLGDFLNLENFFYAVARRHHVIFNASGENVRSTAGKVISRLKEADYRIFVCIVLSRFDIVLGRNNSRAKETGWDVPEHDVKSIFKNLQETIPLYMKSQAKMAEALLVYSNNGDEISTEPKFVLVDGSDPQDAIDFAMEMLAIPNVLHSSEAGKDTEFTEGIFETTCDMRDKMDR